MLSEDVAKFCLELNFINLPYPLDYVFRQSYVITLRNIANMYYYLI